MKRMGAKDMSLFHRLGITLVILGMMQSLAPTCFLPVRSSLRHVVRLAVAPTHLGDPETSVEPLLAGPTLPASSGQNQGSDRETHDPEDLSETIAWPGAMTDRRSSQGVGASAAFGSLANPARVADRTLPAHQRLRSLSIFADASSRMIVRLCRFTC